ncbi:MAG: tyrosine-type recombinase/integrase [Bacteroidota bacterium]|nr:tyrosine-type recombinase/integrase [Bacteroidota bacterium]
MGREFLDFRRPQLKGQWPNKFVAYSYRNPETGKWERFKVYEDINRNRSKQYDELLLASVYEGLKAGYNPFEDRHPFREKEKPKETPYTIQRALYFFLGKWKERGIEPASMARYQRSIKFFEEWLLMKGIQHKAAGDITEDDIESSLRWNKEKRGWSNRTYNNNRDFLATCFLFLQKKGVIKSNPVSEVASQKTKTKKHKYYDEVTLKKVMGYLRTADPSLHLAALVVYHLCVRSEKELKHLVVGNIMPERMQVLLQETKGGSERYIPMNQQILDAFREADVLEAPKDYYVFSGNGRPGAKPFGNGFFAKRFRKVRGAMGLGEESTLYGFKHTRIVHLKRDGVKDADIMQLTGHKDVVSYSTYLRDLGVDFKPDKLNAASRTI